MFYLPSFQVTTPATMSLMTRMRIQKNIRPRKQTDYVKENIDQSMSFKKVGNDLFEDAFSFLQHKGMEHSGETIDYAKVIAHEFPQYSLHYGLKERGERRRRR